MNCSKVFFFLSFISTGFASSAQVFPVKNYPKGYFQWPVDATVGLAANFGELRPNHYHMGLDCRTDQVQNKRVFAAADGYIAKVKIEPSGFGRCIYINHPNGLTTVYAHLNEFMPALEKYVTEQQYKLQSWKIFIDIPANLFPVKKGQVIAYSGSTGGSEGPHTHFEIRDTKTDKVLNTLLFGFPITDNIPPSVLRLAVYDRSISVYEQTPKIYPLRKVNGVFMPPASLLIEHTDKVSFAITAFDRYIGSTHENGIYQAVLYDNEKPVVGFDIDSISYDQTRDVNAHIDYKLKNSGGPYVQHLSKLSGYNESIYKEISGDGVIDISNDSTHQIKIAVMDAYGNTSYVKFDVRSNIPYKPKTAADSIEDPNEFLPGCINVFENNNISFYLPEASLYDSIRFKYNVLKPNSSYDVSDIFELQNGTIPIHGYFPIKIKGNVSDTFKDKIVMERYWGNKKDFAKADDQNGWYKAAFKEFGYFKLLLDTIPPIIKPIGFRDGMNCAGIRRLAFVISDNCSDESKDIINFRAELDGNWLRFTNDKNLAYIYNFDDHCARGPHELKISAEDLAGNKTEKIYHFTR
ncbi:MAG TPA: M23 family metallopeptidase [Ferruginibacter sp.]|jgi:hypothetical protein|nr:M23 family metallopeptidase [Ferruginibacter sp.]